METLPSQNGDEDDNNNDENDKEDDKNDDKNDDNDENYDEDDNNDDNDDKDDKNADNDENEDEIFPIWFQRSLPACCPKAKRADRSRLRITDRRMITRVTLVLR